jgi:AcrR family transcriptional regulator
MVEQTRVDGGEKVDGRHERVRAGKIQAYKSLLELFADGRVNPSQAELAAKAGISERTLFRYFNSYEEIVAGAIGYVFPSLKKFFEAEAPAGDLEHRLRMLADLRVNFVKQNGVMARSTEALAPTSEAARLAKYFRDNFFAEQVAHWIGSDRSRINDAELAVIQNLFSFLSVDALYITLGDACIDPLVKVALSAFK